MQEVVVLVFILYYLFVVGLWIGWRRAGRSNRQSVSQQPFVTIIIPMRNEASVIVPLITDICTQQYPCYEVLVVDDHSTDDTVSVIEKYIIHNPDTKAILLYNQGVGKKAAIETAVKAARGEWILQTDADCHVPHYWVERMASRFEDNINMVIGGVRFRFTDFFGRLQQMEFASLIGSGAATLGWKVPTMANGANLAYRKKIFESVGGYSGNEYLASGDDEFLLHKIHHAFPGTIDFNNDTASVVETAAQPTIVSFVQQRVRWASKWKGRRDVATQLVAVTVFACQVIFLVTPWFAFVGMLTPLFVLALLGIRAMVELVFFLPVLRFLSVRFSVVSFVLLQFLYPYYVAGVAALSVFVKYRWKDR